MIKAGPIRVFPEPSFSPSPLPPLLTERALSFPLGPNSKNDMATAWDLFPQPHGRSNNLILLEFLDPAGPEANYCNKYPFLLMQI